MRNSMRGISFFLVLVLMAAVALSGCSTRRYAREAATTAAAAVDAKLPALVDKDRELGERIDAVDRRAQTGISEAQAARQGAATADQKAVAADTKATAAQEAATTADGKAVTADRKAEDALGRVSRLSLASLENYQVTDTQTVTFQFNRSSLSNNAKATLDRIASSVQNQGGYVVELRGFTDSTGSESYNYGLSQRRAESVRRYLVEKNVPLRRISLVGLGESNPAADNRTAAGRQQNRRVQIQVLRAQGQSGM